jgi:hypothetical protein
MPVVVVEHHHPYRRRSSRTASTKDAAVNNRRSSSPSSIPDGTGQVMPMMIRGTTQILGHRRSADADRDRDLPLARAYRMLQSQDFEPSSLGGHRISPLHGCKEGSSHYSSADSESASTTLNKWPASSRLQSDSVAGLARNM